MSGHRSSRRQSYGKRQKDVRGRSVDEMTIDLDGPSGWLRARGWSDAEPTQRPASNSRGRRPGPSLGSASA
ncbi:MAG: hypothetical protein U0667_06810 [Chloroflexota bacterium]